MRDQFTARHLALSAGAFSGAAFVVGAWLGFWPGVIASLSVLLWSLATPLPRWLSGDLSRDRR